MSDTETTEATPDEATEQEAPDAPLEGDQTEPTVDAGADADDAPGAPDDFADDSESDDEEAAEEEAANEPSSEAMTAAMDKAFRNIEKRAAGYADAATELIVNTEQPIMRCSFCLPKLPGFYPAPNVQPWTPDQLAFARAVLGQPDEPPLVQANDAKMCQACEGWGKVLTGSRRNDQKSRKCFVCNGIGWEGRGAGDVTPSNGTTTLSAVPTLEQPPEDVPDRDPWGRPPGHPGFYKMPHPGMALEEMPPGMTQVAGV